MRVLITGGAGHIGKSTTERLLQNGWDVRIVSIESDVEIEGAEYIQCNILNYDDLLKQMHGCEAVIHLAAIRSPYLAPGHEVFQVNVAGTFNVFEAAAAAGIRRVVQASSINAIGCFYSTGEIEARYFPIDEEHPCYTTDPYSFSKQSIEDIGAYFWRREGISSVAMRFPGVYHRDYTASDSYHQRKETARNFLDEFLSLPEPEQQERIAEVKKRSLAYRSQRPYEFRLEQEQTAPKVNTDDPLFRSYAFDRYNFWAFVDERDAAQSLEKGLTADYVGDHALFINDHHNWLDYDSKTLIRLFFPEVGLKSDLPGSAALVSIDKARQLIGFEPEYSIEKLGQL
jgi:nucleoside-diphosphate-sugar epimerase